MTLETMQREGREKVYKDIIYWVMNPSAREAIFTPKEANDVIDQHTANVWMAAQESIKKSILESGLLEKKTVKELYPEANTEVADHKLACQVFGKERNNTLARDIKEFISNMDKV